MNDVVQDGMEGFAARYLADASLAKCGTLCTLYAVAICRAGVLCVPSNWFVVRQARVFAKEKRPPNKIV